MHKNFEKYWIKLKRRFNLLALLSILIPLAAAIIFLLAIANSAPLSIPLPFWIVYVLSTIGLLLLWNSKIKWGNQKLIHYLHQKYPDLEYSLGLFFKEESNSLEKLQQSKVYQKLPPSESVKFPIDLNKGLISLIISALLYSSSFFYQTEKLSENQAETVEVQIEDRSDSTTQDDIRKFDFELFVYPPDYTGLSSFQWKKDRRVAEGSRLVFTNKGSVDFDLIWQNQYDFSLSEDQSKSFVFNNSSIFQIKYVQNDSTISLKPVILEILKDEAPVLSTNLNENRHEIEWQDLSKNFQLDLSIKDDYGIESTDIIMTLSRGEGESVRFREMKQAVSGISKGRRQQQIGISLPLDTFSLEPGDELYFYFSAMDNKVPDGNKARTDVYFLTVADTVLTEPVAYEGFALTNEAEYFKSQRQIIIDTEKLLDDRDKISSEEFDQRSNSIGADQKLLRLRYGVFLGEEFETTGGLGEVDHSGHDHGELGKDDHVSEDSEQESHAGHDHESEANFSNPIYNETPELEAYVHAHDESELSTFLDANVKAKLKAALTNMWEAELYLRTYKPKKAIPYEYEALKLIKEVKRASRIYVERMGFEPPAIDEEKKRLSGELDKIDAQETSEEKKEKSFEEKLFATYSQLKPAYQQQNMNKAVNIMDDFVDDLVLKITSEPVRYGNLLGAVKEFQSRQSRTELRTVLMIMEDMLNLQDLQKGSQEQSIRTSLHQTYYDLIND